MFKFRAVGLGFRAVGGFKALPNLQVSIAPPLRSQLVDTPVRRLHVTQDEGVRQVWVTGLLGGKASHYRLEAYGFGVSHSRFGIRLGFKLKQPRAPGIFNTSPGDPTKLNSKP